MFGIGGTADGSYSVPEPSEQAADINAPKANIGGSMASGAMAGTAIMPGWGTVIGAGIGLLGGILGNKSSAKQAQEQMSFQERMSSTAHQREVADLQKAGLNPVLSATHGGSSTPGGAMGQVSNIGESAISGAKAGFEADVQRKLVGQQLLNQGLDAENTSIDTQKKISEANLMEDQRKEVRARVINTGQDTAYKAAQTSLAAQQALTERYRRGLITKQAFNEGLQGILLKQEQELNESRKFILSTDAKSSSIDREVMAQPGEAVRRRAHLWGSTAGVVGDAIPFGSILKGLGKGIGKIFKSSPDHPDANTPWGR
ncbi:MAG: DNA pilot protein [Microvirus sp.]|nr:MAG: DNA pilot protein [Microvirus sp.]